MTLANIASILTSPLVHAPILFLIVRLVGYARKNSKLYNYLSIIPIAWLFICSMTYPSVLLIKNLEDKYPVVSLQSDVWKTTDAIVVLACNYFEDDDLPFVSRWPNCSLQRNLHAALMYKIHPIPIYLAGGILGKKDKNSQASHNQYFFESMGVDIEDIYTVAKGVNTETEVAALASLLKGKKVALVTSASHLPRAVTYFELHNIEVLPIPVEHLSKKHVEPVLGLPNAISLYRSERAIHEYLGLIYQHYLR